MADAQTIGEKRTPRFVPYEGGFVVQDAPATYYFHGEVRDALSFRLWVARTPAGQDLVLDVDLGDAAAVLTRLGEDGLKIVLREFEIKDIAAGSTVFVGLSLVENKFTATLNHNKFELQPEGEAGMQFQRAFGEFGAADDGFLEPRAMATDGQGNVYIADAGDHRVRKFNARGELLSVLGGPGEGIGRFNNPGGVAVDRKGCLYVADTGNHRIQKFAANGDFVYARGGHRSGGGRLFAIDSTAMAADGTLYVLDTSDGSLHGYNSRGEFLSRRVLRTPRTLRTFRPTSVAANAFGDIYFGDKHGGPILRFDADLNYMGLLNREKFHVRALAVDTLGQVFVACARTRKVHCFSAQGDALRESRKFRDVATLRADYSGNLLILDAGDHRVHKFSDQDRSVFSMGGYGTNSGRFRDPRDIAVKRDGGFFIADAGNRRIQEFDEDGAFVAVYDAGNQVRELAGIALDRDEGLLLIDGELNSIRPHGTPDTGENSALDVANRRGSALGYPNEPTLIAVDSKDRLYILDRTSGLIHKTDASGAVLKVIGESEEANLLDPRALALDERDDLYVAHGDGVYRFDAAGDFQESFLAGTNPRDIMFVESKLFTLNSDSIHDSAGRSGEGEVNISVSSGSIAMAQGMEGEVHVLHGDTGYVATFSSMGEKVREWGGRRPGDGRLFDPTDVVADGDGNAFVADGGDSDSFLHSFGKDGKIRETLPAGKGNYATSVVRTDDGSFFVVDPRRNLIHKLNEKGEVLVEWDGTVGGSPAFVTPIALVPQDSGEFYIVERNAHRVRRLGADGRTLGILGGRGSEPGKFMYPDGLASDGAGRLLILDGGNHRIQYFPGGEAGPVVWGNEALGLSEPASAAFDEAGNFHITDAHDDRIKLFQADGTLLAVWGGSGEAAGQFRNPAGIHFGDEELYVLDAGNFRVQVFRSAKEDEVYPGRPGMEEQAGEGWAVLAGKNALIPPRASGTSGSRRESFEISAYHLLSLSANQGKPGDEVILRGSGFSERSRVLLGGMPQFARVSGPEELRVRIGPTAVSGVLIVRDAAHMSIRTEPTFFKVIVPPRITAIVPQTVAPGEVVEILGEGLQGSSVAVKFDEIDLEILRATSTRIEVRVPADAGSLVSREARVSVDGAIAAFSPVTVRTFVTRDLVGRAPDARIEIGHPTQVGALVVPTFGGAENPVFGSVRWEQNRRLIGVDDSAAARILRMSPPALHGGFIELIFPDIRVEELDELELEFGYLDLTGERFVGPGGGEGDGVVENEQTGASFSAYFQARNQEERKNILEPIALSPSDGPRRIVIPLGTSVAISDSIVGVWGDIALRVSASEVSMNMISCWSRIRLNNFTK